MKIYRKVIPKISKDVIRSLLANHTIEADALRTRDSLLAATAAHVTRLENIKAQIVIAEANGTIVVPSYTFDSMEVVLTYPGAQAGPRLGIEVHGTVRAVRYGGPDGTTEISETESLFESIFAVVESQDGHYLIVAEVPVS